MTLHITVPAVATILGGIGYLVLPGRWAELAKVACLAGAFALLVNLK
jgi:hypothetical protein